MKKKIIFVIICIILISLSIALFKLLKDKNEDTDFSTVITQEERQLWSEFLKRNPYIAELKINEMYIDETEFIKTAISSQDIETEYIVTEEIKKNPDLSTGDGYKKSKEEINKYLKKTFNREPIQYNLVEPYVEDNKYLIIGEDYVYFTKIELPKREYILIELEKNGNNFEAKIYEYEVNENNKSQIEEMLNTGKINKSIEIFKEHIITGTINNENICILTKT